MVLKSCCTSDTLHSKDLVTEHLVHNNKSDVNNRNEGSHHRVASYCESCDRTMWQRRAIWFGEVNYLRPTFGISEVNPVDSKLTCLNHKLNLASYLNESSRELDVNNSLNMAYTKKVVNHFLAQIQDIENELFLVVLVWDVQVLVAHLHAELSDKSAWDDYRLSHDAAV
ncbi:hypothetical protein J6590_003281 [Homalodisca vitripennis]|nr:hypothetical protein J6590_003281 [Homalodisca vitripennis]